MNRRYKLSRRYRRKVNKIICVSLMMASLLCGYGVGCITTKANNEQVEEVHVVIPDETVETVETVAETSEKMVEVTVNPVNAVAKSKYIELKDEDAVAELEEQKENEQKESAKQDIDAQVIRCTGYNDVGYTKSGEWTREGVIAGKKEWLGRTCNLYSIAEDGSIGDLIGSYTFLDTGYGINGSLVKGTSVDVWHPSEDSVWQWMATYGDYVYIEFTS